MPLRSAKPRSTRAQLALDAIYGLARHGADIEIEAAVVRVARQPPRRAAADRGDRHVRMLAHVDMRRLVVARPFRDVALQLVHHRDRVDDVRPVGERGMRDRAADRDAHPDHAHVGARDPHAGRLGEQREVGSDAVGREMPRADAVAGILDALEFLDRGLLDLADHAAERDIAASSMPALHDRLDRDQRRRKSALHVVGAESPDPAVAIDRLWLEALAGEMLLVARIGRVHVAGEQEIEPIATAVPVADRVRPARLDQRQVGVHAGALHARDEILRDADLAARSGLRCRRGPSAASAGRRR